MDTRRSTDNIPEWQRMESDLYQRAERLAQAAAVNWFARLRPRPRHIGFDDIRLEARLATWKASGDYDRNRGASFETHAANQAVYAAQKYLRVHGRPPGMTTREYDRKGAQYRSTTQFVDFPEHELEAVSLDQFVGDAQDTRLGDLIHDHRSFESEVLASALWEAMRAQLDPRELHAMTRVRIEGESQYVVAAEMGLSQMQVSRIMRGAQRKLAEVWNAEGLGKVGV